MTTELFLLIHSGIFILTIFLSLLLVKLKDVRVTVSFLLIAAAMPIFNVWLLGILIYELGFIFWDRRRR